MRDGCRIPSLHKKSRNRCKQGDQMVFEKKIAQNKAQRIFFVKINT
jgi:hypothetical protein